MLPVTIVDNTKKPQYLVIWLHGLGANGQDFVDFIPRLQLPADFPVRFVFPDAPTRPVTLNQGLQMPAWFDIYSLAKDEREDEAGIREAAEWIADLIAKQTADLGVTSRNVMLVGFSQGGALALYTGLRYPQKLAGLVGLSTYLPLTEALSAELNEVNQNCPIFLSHGDRDPVVLPKYARKMHQWLLSRNYPVQWQEYPMAHTVCLPQAIAIQQFMQASFTRSCNVEQ